MGARLLWGLGFMKKDSINGLGEHYRGLVGDIAYNDTNATIKTIVKDTHLNLAHYKPVL